MRALLGEDAMGAIWLRCAQVALLGCAIGCQVDVPSGLRCPDGQCPFGEMCEPQWQICYPRSWWSAMRERDAAVPELDRSAPDVIEVSQPEETLPEVTAVVTPPLHAAGEAEADAGPADPPDDARRDPCAFDHGGCDRLVTCKRVGESTECGGCPAGYDDVYRDGTRCTDIDECAAAAAVCGDNALCRNTPGSYTCRCRPGFEFQADLCVDIDECASGRNDCDDDPAACVDEVGGYRCVCPEGFTGSGRGSDGCLGIDECALGLHDCDRDPAACQDLAVGYACVCPQGYAGDGRGPQGCQDSNECPAECDTEPFACVNTSGGHICQCPAGYEGLGLGANGCTDVDECALGQHDCDRTPNACTNTPGTYLCKCPAGYAGTGIGEAGCTAL